MNLKLFKSKLFLTIIFLVLLVLAPSAYAGVSYYQSDRLIAEAARLAESGDYAGAIAKYEQAQGRWIWNYKRIYPQKEIAIRYQDQARILSAGESHSENGEWQKCLDSLSRIEQSFPKYSQAQEQYTICKGRLNEQKAAVTTTAASSTAAKSASSGGTTSASGRTTSTSRGTSVYTTKPSGAVDNCTYATPVGHGEYYGSICISGSDAFRQKVKQGLAYLQNKSSYYYGLAYNHTGKIGQNIESGGACQATYDQYYAGFYSPACTYCISGGKGLIILDSVILGWPSSDVAGLILHEALHSMPGMCWTGGADALNSIHAQMRQNWEDPYNSL